MVVPGEAGLHTNTISGDIEVTYEGLTSADDAFKRKVGRGLRE